MDIDIDLSDSFNFFDCFGGVRASILKDGVLTPHNTSYYLQNIPKDKITGLSAIPYKDADKLGYFKIDFLKLHILDKFKSKQEIKQLLKNKPNFDLLQDKNILEKTPIFQLHNQYSIVSKVKPTNIQELADTIALVRPGKRQLLYVYLKDKPLVRDELYKQNDDGYSYKKSHAISYAMTIVLQLNMIENGYYNEKI